MIWLDIEFVGKIRARLDRFKIKQNNPYLANFRCPVCGDSKKNKYKARGYLFTKPGGLFYMCHNCNVSISFGKLIEILDPELAQQYSLEKYKSKNAKSSNTSQQLKAPVANTALKFTARLLDQLMDSLEAINFSTENHPALEFAKQRMLPTASYDKLYYIDDVSKIEQLSPNSRKKIKSHEPRIVIPFYNVNQKLVRLQCRALNDHQLKYITVTIDSDDPGIYGIDSVDLNKTVYVVEGPIDSLFLPNCVAVGTSDLSRFAKAIYPKQCDQILVFDNQPRNQEIVKIIENHANSGYKIVVWPQHVKQKDINDMIIKGKHSVSEIVDIINSNTFQGLALQAAISNWKKI